MELEGLGDREQFKSGLSSGEEGRCEMGRLRYITGVSGDLFSIGRH